MEIKYGRLVLLVIGMIALLPWTAWSAQAAEDPSGFMEDYSLLQPVKGPGPDLLYLPPGIEEKLSGYTKIMIDQPEILLASDSPYRGVKPDEAKALADGFRETLQESFAEQYEVVEEPGEDVLYLRVGLTNLYLKRHVKWYNFTPIGALSLGVKSAFVENVAKKFSLIEVAVEVEFYDSKTNDLLTAGVENMGQAKDKKAGIKQDETSWKELTAYLGEAGDLVHCRLQNAKLPEANRTDCYADKE